MGAIAKAAALRYRQLGKLAVALSMLLALLLFELVGVLLQMRPLQVCTNTRFANSNDY